MASHARGLERARPQHRLRRARVVDVERDARMARARAVDHLGQEVDPLAHGVGQRREQIAEAAARLEHRRVGGDEPRQRRLEIAVHDVARGRMRRRLLGVQEELAPGRHQRLGARRRLNAAPRRPRRAAPFHSLVAHARTCAGLFGLLGLERERLLELLSRAHGDALGLVDLQVRALEADLVLAAGDLVVGERRVLGGVLAVDPDLGPGARADGDGAVAALGGGAGRIGAVVAALGAVGRCDRLARLLARPAPRRSSGGGSVGGFEGRVEALRPRAADDVCVASGFGSDLGSGRASAGGATRAVAARP